MPHIQVDHSPDFDPSPLLPLLTTELSAIESVDPAAVKAYCRPAAAFSPGTGAPKGFIHLSVCVLAGRPGSVLAQMADRLDSVARTYLAGRVPYPMSLTLEIREMDPQTYRKGAVH
ncbi:MAG: hypothetical protein KF743_01600 [Fimbriimonadaceae bacterium]|nr:hypothetical protein [Fimbriimonadaceae bacterium]